MHAERSQSGRSSFRFCELFAGIGGFRLGLEPLGGKCTFASEIEADARQVYTKNFGGEPPAGNILDISTDDIPAFDLLTGGFPCQSWSEAGDVGGFADLRGVLFFEITRMLHAKKPAGFLLENVPNLAKVTAPAPSRPAFSGDVHARMHPCMAQLDARLPRWRCNSQKRCCRWQTALRLS